MKNSCEICQEEYSVIKPWQKYCSKKCKDKAFFLRNPEAKSKYNKKSARTPIFKYHVQKNGAKRRGIGFYLTFEEWWGIWEPFWNMRGVNRESLVMCRKNDTGPYQVGNVYIDTYSNNSRLAAVLKPANRDAKTGRFI